MKIGLDIGRVRVGVAVSDPSARMALPSETLERAGGKAEKRVLELIIEHGADELVVGLPLGDTGQVTEQCEDIERFCHRIARRSPVKIVMVDEYASSADAEELTAAYGRRREGKKGMIDAVAASIILQAYLDGNVKGLAFKGSVSPQV